MMRLAADGYWPAQAARAIVDGRFSSAVRLCRDYLAEHPDLLSGRMIYATALFRSGQLESAAEELHGVLSQDPDHLAALKLLGDVRFALGDNPAAMATYRRILEIDPHCRGLASPLAKDGKTATRTITITRQPESRATDRAARDRKIPFVTETIGDLYLAQGHHRLAQQVFRKLMSSNENPRLAQKLARAEAAGNSKINHTPASSTTESPTEHSDSGEST